MQYKHALEYSMKVKPFICGTRSTKIIHIVDNFNTFNSGSDLGDACKM